MALSLEQLTAAFKKQDSSENRPNNYYRFWDMKDGQHAVVRFLPDLDENNGLGFTVEKFMHTLEINGEYKSVPCLKMYDEQCPICKVSSEYYKDEGKDSVNGKKYWRKKQHIVQALIIEDPLAPDPETGENSEGKVKFLNMGYQVFSVIKEAFESEELDDIPYLYKGGCNFIIKKIVEHDRAKYDTGSKFARKSTDLTEDEISIAEDASVNLSTLLPPNPGLEKVESMLMAALTGKPLEYDDSKEPASAEKVAAKADNPVKEDLIASEKEEESSSEFDAENEDILEIIRKRRNKAAQ